MKKLGFALLLLMCALPLAAQQTLQSNWNQVVALAPPAIVNSLTSSSTTGTGVQVSATGGAIAAGTYRCGVTLFTATNTETPLSVDTATTAVITTTGSTSTITIQAPVTSGAPANVVGWRPYCGVSGGASGAETLVVLNSTVCTLSTSTTASCSLTSPALLSLQSQFAAGAGGPASPGTAVFPQIANQANQYLFENSAFTYHVIYWVVTGTAPSACTFNIQGGASVAALANVGQTITCTASGGYALPLNTTYAYTAINLATYTAGSTTTSVAFYETSYVFPPFGPLYFGNAAPTSACQTGFYQNTAATSVLYYCAAATWTIITLP
jgi:hypothetical protein